MYVIVGLGNPDKKYEHTRHNIGFDVIDALADKYNISVTDKKHKALCGSGVIEGMKVLLVKPQTYMNLSGESVAEVMNFYKLDPDEEMIVIFDDISLSVPEGSVTAITGQNGAGKTTLAQILCGLTKQTRGHICLLYTSPSPRDA